MKRFVLKERFLEGWICMSKCGQMEAMIRVKRGREGKGREGKGNNEAKEREKCR